MWRCLLGLAILLQNANCQSCTIQNTSGASTDLSGVTAMHWDGPDGSSSSHVYTWELSLCQLTQGICESKEYDGYIQQSGQGGNSCAKNAWFAKYTAGSGGQGEPITLSYEGNEIINPPMGRIGHVEINCDASGPAGQLTPGSCSVNTQNTGSDWVYTFTCKGNIACKSSGPPPPGPGEPSPGPGPSPPGPSPTGTGKAPGGWIFVGILLGVIFIYIVAGLIFGIAVKKQPVGEAFPNIEFWKDFPGLVKDGVMFTVSPCTKR